MKNSENNTPLRMIEGQEATYRGSWLQVERGDQILVFGSDSSGTFLAIYKGNFSHQLARFDTSLAELTGLMELWKRR